MIFFGSLPWCRALLPLHRPLPLVTHIGADVVVIHQPAGLPLNSVFFHRCLKTHASWVLHAGQNSPLFMRKSRSLSFTCLEVFILVTIRDFMLNGLTLLQREGNIWNANERPRQNRRRDLLEKLWNQPRCRGERLWREYSLYLCCGKHIAFVRWKRWGEFPVFEPVAKVHFESSISNQLDHRVLPTEPQYTISRFPTSHVE